MKYRRMDYIDRLDLEEALEQGHNLRKIGKLLKFHPSTIGRELKRNRSSASGRYTGGHANRMTWGRQHWRRQPRKMKGWLRIWVIGRLKQYWSPEQICGRLKQEKGLSLAPETVYRLVERDRKRINQGGDGLLWTYLRHGRKQRRRRCVIWNRTGKRQNLPNISLRPTSANKRLYLGHWERDTMFGDRRTQALLVAADRKSRYTRMNKMNSTDTQETTRKTKQLLKRLPRRSVTNDRGPEFVNYQPFQSSTSVPVYFCNPYTACERGTVENTIGLIRQFLPKGKTINDVEEKDLKRIENYLNHRPRKCLDWKTPYEVMYRKTVALCT